jgi:hypothetical protein
MTEEMKSQPAKHDGERLRISDEIKTAGLDPKYRMIDSSSSSRRNSSLTENTKCHSSIITIEIPVDSIDVLD